MHINSGHRMSLQYHKKKEETIFVMSGLLLIWEKSGEEHIKLNPGQTYHVVPGQVHRFGASEEQGCMILEVSTPEIEDVVRLEDDYER